MLTVRWSLAAGVVAEVVTLAALGMTVGLSPCGWAVGVTCAVVTNAAVARGAARGGSTVLGPADLVTLTRTALACGVASLTAEALLGRPFVTTLVTLAATALVLDAVDGWVARRTHTASAFGARFDGEADAFLILVLSVYVAREMGVWVLAVGAARYVFAMAGWGLPWMRGQLPFRYWRKVVAAIQGIALTVAAAEILPRSWSVAALAVALGLLAESFGRDVWWLCRNRPAGPAQHGRRHRAAAGVTNAIALLLVWFALVGPTRVDQLTPSAFLRFPVEGVVVAGLALVLPSRARRTMAALIGLLLGVLAMSKALDLGFYRTLGRPFDVMTDRDSLGSAVAFVRDSLGSVAATGVVVAAVALAAVALIGMPWSVVRLTAFLARHRNQSALPVIGLGASWIMCASLGLHLGDGEPIASMSATRLAVSEVREAAASVREQQGFDAAAAVDGFRRPAEGDLVELRGKDVLIVFVESYGRVAVEGSPHAPQVQAALAQGTQRLQAQGYSAKSAFLTSPTFGGGSWLAHATFQSGVWVDNQWEYDRLLSGDRATINRAFDGAGWRTVAVLPSNRGAWPEGEAYYGFDKIYDRSDFGYAGPTFGFSAMPDQYALWAFQRLELEKSNRPPVMAQIDLTSSHGPWAPLPTLVDWDSLGDGSVFHRVHGQAESAAELWRRRENVPAAYTRSIEYTLHTLISFVQRYGDDDLVLVVLGDHQPSTIVSGLSGNHDVPITVIARDPRVMGRVSGWGWTDGLRPGRGTPVWRMDEFRDRFLAAYSHRQGASTETP